MTTIALYVVDALDVTNTGTILRTTAVVSTLAKYYQHNQDSDIVARAQCPKSPNPFNVLTYHSQCVYHPAPLTKTRGSPDVAIAAPSLPNSSERASPVQQQTTPISPPSMMPNAFIPDQPSNRSSASAPSFQGSPALPRTLSAARGTQMLSTASHRSPETYSSRDARTGFLGPTSYSAVYTENSGKRITPLISHSLYPRATHRSIICHCHSSNVHHKQ